MAKKKIMKLSHGLVLNRYILSLFQVTGFDGLTKYLKDSNLEGYDENKVSEIHHALKLRLFDNDKLTKELLFEYDQNIVSHTLAISEHRGSEIKWKYFQYLTLLFTEIYLDKYFTDVNALLTEINDFVDRFNNPLDKEVPNENNFVSEKYTLKDLNKLAIWSATGSGKTLLLHVNIKQYISYSKKYNKKNFNKILLITPNEGLSNQHLLEFKESNIQAELFSKTSGTAFSGQMVEIIEISKLSEENGDKTVAVDSFETNNIVLIDEGHRGAAGDEWKRRRDQLSDDGFAIEYSATFGQAISAASAKKKTELLNEYSKAVLFDYSYKYFYKDGYGKDYKILNIKEDNNEEYLRKYLTANLLTFYQQQLVFSENKSCNTYNLEKPLWVFVGGSVTKSVNKKEASDVVSIVKFISNFIKDSIISKDYIKQILDGKGGLNDKNGNSIFANSFSYINNKTKDIDIIYKDILEKVFNTKVIGANIYVDNLKSVDGEIGIRIGDSQEYFGVINVGDSTTLHKLLLESNILGMDKDFSESQFKKINQDNSPINILIGSKKFTEGWSSWRVSSMGLMNIGKGEGSQIIQLFGRGVRLKGYGYSLKRSSMLDDYQRPKTKTPKYIPILETLNIFGIKADYMQQFKEFLEEEGLLTNDDTFTTITIPTINRYIKQKEKLKVIKTKKGVAENYKKENIVVLEITDISQSLDIQIDWYPKIQMLASKQGSINDIDTKEYGQKLSKHNLAFIDWDKVFFEIQKFKNERSWYNLSVTKENLISIIKNDEWYNISIPTVDLEAKSYDKIFIWEELVLALLKNYTEKFYLAIKNQHLAQYIEVSVLDESDKNFIDEYTVSVSETETDIISKLLEFKEKVKTNDYFKDDFELSSSFIGFDNEQHLFYPLMYMDEKKFKDIVKITPVQFNKGEKDFLNDLKIYYKTHKEYFIDKKIYLLRNQSRSGIGFLTETKNFYPDFILWQVVGDKQYISFIDPKGIYNLRNLLTHPKVMLYKTIKTEFQNTLEDKKTFLNSFIISNTSQKEMQFEQDINDYHDVNIYFQKEDKHTYIENILEKGLIE